MDDYIVKPFDAQPLVASILRRATPARAELLWLIDGVLDRRAPGAPTWLEIEGIDLTDARERGPCSASNHSAARAP